MVPPKEVASTGGQHLLPLIGSKDGDNLKKPTSWDTCLQAVGARSLQAISKNRNKI